MNTSKPAAQPQRRKQASTDNAPSNETHRTAAPPTGEPVQTSSVPTTTEVGSEAPTTWTDPSITTAAAPILVESAGQISECAETSMVPVPIAPMADAPEPIVLPPAIELAAIEPVLPPTQVDYSTLDIKALDEAIVKSLEIAGHYAKQFDAEKKAHLLPALMEMETRWNKKQGARSDLSRLPIYGKWHDYLRHCGLKPSTYRSWKKGYYDAIALTSPQLGEESASLPSSDVLTSVQEEVVSALVGQGYRQSDARALVKAIKGDTFAELFKNCLANRLKAADRQERPAPATVPSVESYPTTATPAEPAPVTPSMDSESNPTKPAEPTPVTTEPMESESIPEPKPTHLDIETILGGKVVPDETSIKPENEHEALLVAAEKAAGVATTPDAVKRGAEPSPSHERFHQDVNDEATMEPPQSPAILAVASETKAGSVTPEEFQKVLGAVLVPEVQSLKDETSARIKEIQPWIEEQLARLQRDAKADASACKTKYIGDAIDTFAFRFAYSFASVPFRSTVVARDKGTYPDDLRHVAKTIRRGGELLLSMANNMAQVSAEEQPKEHAPANDTKPDSDGQGQSPCPESVTTQSSTEKAVETSAETGTVEPPTQSVPKKRVKVSTVKSVKADGITVKPGYLCKFQGTDWEIVAVFPGDDPMVNLIRLHDDKRVGSVSVSELRFVTDPDAAA